MKHPIPDAAVKESGAIIGRTGSGKTYVAKGLVERLLSEEARVCIIDPTGVWWGLRSSADGKAPAFPVVVFGGDHADVEITDASGNAVALTLAEQNLPAIVDVSEFTMAGRIRFVTAFLERLYIENRMPLTLVIDEADLFAPQRPGKDELTLLGRMEQICRRGRVRGFRPWLITQRPASLHKSVLSQANTLVAMQLTAPQDRDALGTWIEGQADRDEGKKILAELPKLKKGEGFVWAPHHDVLARVKFPTIATFDSSRSPDEGEVPQQLKLAAVDLSKIGDELRQIEEEEGETSEDPRELLARIAELEAQVARGGEAEVNVEDLQREFERGKIAGEAEAYESWKPHLSRLRDGLVVAIKELDAFGEVVLERQRIRMAPPELQDPTPLPTRALEQAKRAVPRVAGTGELGNSGKRRMLIALAQHRAAGLTPTKLSILTGISRGGGTWRTYLGELRSAGWVEGSDQLKITADGMKALGSYDPLPTGRALIEYWRQRLGDSGKRKIFDVVVAAHPRALAPEAVAAKTDIAIGGGTWRTYVGELRGLELITGRGELRASDDLFR
jgi:hypothetical protein